MTWSHYVEVTNSLGN